MSEANARLEALREVLSGPPSAARWTRLMRLLEPRPAALELQYAEGHLASWPEALRRAPRRWGLEGGGDLWGLVRGLDLSGQGIGDEGLRKLLQSGRLEGLAWLDLSGNQLTDRSAALLASSGAGGALRRLELGRNRLGAPGAVLLSRADALQHLCSLGLAENPVGDDGVAALCTGRFAGGLRALELRDAGVGVAGAAALARSPWPALESLVLCSNRIMEAGLVALGQAAGLLALRRLEISAPERCLAGLRALGGGRWPAQLEALELRSSRLGSEAAGLFEGAWTSLRQLGLGSCGLQSVGLRGLLRARLPALEALDLAHNGLTAEDAAALSRSGLLSQLKMLDLTGNPLREAGLAALASLPLPALERLEVRGCGGGEGGWLAALLGAAPGLASLDASANGLRWEGLRDLPPGEGLRAVLLSDNPLGRPGSEAIGPRPWPRLERLGLASARLEPAALRQLGAQGWWRGLSGLELGCNPLGSDGLEALLSALEPGLVELGLGFARLGRASGLRLAGCAALASLERLELGDNAMEDAGCRALGDAEHFHNLRQLGLRNNKVGLAGLRALLSSSQLSQLELLELSRHTAGWRAAVAVRRRTGLPALEHVELGEATTASALAAGLSQWWAARGGGFSRG